MKKVRFFSSSYLKVIYAHNFTCFFRCRISFFLYAFGQTFAPEAFKVKSNKWSEMNVLCFVKIKFVYWKYWQVSTTIFFCIGLRVVCVLSYDLDHNITVIDPHLVYAIGCDFQRSSKWAVFLTELAFVSETLIVYRVFV